MQLRDLLRALDQGYQVSGDPTVEVTGIVSDSRRARPGSLFVAIPGTKHDGHRFIEEALARGAVAVVGERPLAELEADGSAPYNKPRCYVQVEESRRALAELAAEIFGRPTEKLFTVGITGTKGKTTAAHLAAEVLGPQETELISTVTSNLELGLANTTPDPLTIQGLARRALREGKQNYVLEVSAHALSQWRVHRVDFDVAVFTNLSHDHLDYYGSMGAYFQAKLKLFALLRPEATAVVNRDEPHSRFGAIVRATRAKVLSYGLSAGAEVRAERVELELEGAHFILRTPAGSVEVHLKLPGRFNVYNALAAAGVGLARGIPLEEIAARLGRAGPVPGRLERHRARGGFDVVIDFAHSPAALAQAIEALRPYYHRVLTVFGCGGESDRSKRPVMGRIAGELSDYVIVTSDNPKSEDPEEIIAQVVAGLKGDGIRASWEAIVDRREAIRRAIALARPGDVVLIAGKGHEREQVFADRTESFNDLEFLRSEGLLEELEG